MVRKIWLWICQSFTVLFILWMQVRFGLGIPITETNGTTLLQENARAEVAVAKALATAIGNPSMTLDTNDVSRYLFVDGTSVDLVSSQSSFKPPYPITALKQIVLPLGSTTSPFEVAGKVVTSLKKSGYDDSSIEGQPDKGMPVGAVVLVFSNAFMNESGTGYAVLVRKNALRIGGPQPKRFSGW